VETAFARRPCVDLGEGNLHAEPTSLWSGASFFRYQNAATVVEALLLTFMRVMRSIDWTPPSRVSIFPITGDGHGPCYTSSSHRNAATSSRAPK
jgi:hypothetical protein